MLSIADVVVADGSALRCYHLPLADIITPAAGLVTPSAACSVKDGVVITAEIADVFENIEQPLLSQGG